jgi:predicted helicase
MLMTDAISDLHLVGAGSSSQCFPFYVYDEGGQHRRENITDWALTQFRDHYADPQIGKWDIFHYVYALLHHPGYRERYAANLKKELPRIPLAPDFRAFAAAGKRLADLHLTYETIEPYPLAHQWTPGKKIHWGVTGKMRLITDKTAVKVNDALTLSGIPPAAHDYRLGNRSALEWIIDQYQLKTDKRSGITSDPNAYSDDEQYIAGLIGRVVRVSVETVELVASLPPFA